MIGNEPRFWSKVDKSGECWEWRAARNSKGYGTFFHEGAPWLAHRVSWVLVHGPVPVGAYVLHHCDNRGCVNPDHLYAGDQFDNMSDRVSRTGIDHMGANNPRTGLTNSDILEIRADVRDQGAIGHSYGISQSQVSAIKTRKSWGHVLGPVSMGRSSRPLTLTDAQVNAIRIDARPQRAIAADYGLAQSNVSRIKNRQGRWSFHPSSPIQETREP